MKKIVLAILMLFSAIFMKAQWDESQLPKQITTGNNVGIGTDSPDYKLDVNGTIHSNEIIIKAGLTDLGIKNYRTSTLNFMSTNGTDSWESGFMTGIVGNPGDVINYPGGLAFYTKAKDGSSSSTSIERMRISYNGYVGIGTNSPAYKLDVNGTIHSNRIILKDGLTDLGGENYRTSLVNFMSTNGTSSWESGFIAGIVGNPGDINNFPGGLAFYTKAKDGSNSSTSIERMRISYNGNVGIGTVETGTHRLAVDGTIGAREIVVETGNWSDYVFKKDYELKKLDEVENFIEENNHLPDVPSEKEVLKNGVALGKMDAILLQKIEELTLYTIQQQKEIENLKTENQELYSINNKLLELQSRLKELEGKK